MELLFWRHSTPTQKLKGKCCIYARLTINGNREELGSTNIKIDLDSWNEGTQRVNSNDHLYNFKNEQLALLETQVMGVYNQLLREGKTISAERMRVLLSAPASITYTAAFDLMSKTYHADKKKTEASKKTLRNVNQLLVRFLISYKRPNILLEEFDPDVMVEYKNWMCSNGYKDSYITRSSRVLKSVTKYAHKKKLISENILEYYHVGKEHIPPPIYIDSQQLSVWMAHKFLHPTAQKVADLFTLYCRTGFHYQDLIQVIRYPADYVRTGVDGKQWIIKPRQKTAVEAKIPVHQFREIRAILDKYGDWSTIPTLSNQKMNDWLKLCVCEINLTLPESRRIYPELSVKHGRCSFADYCLNELGIGKEPLKTMMGRVSDYELDRYVRPDERGVVRAFAQIDLAKVS